MKLARELYGSKLGELAFVIGCGPSISLARRHLTEPHPHSFRIAINAAIEEIPAEYWIWIDGDAYERHKSHPNAKTAIQLGVEHFRHLYEPDVYVWERALKYPEDIRALKVVHRATSLVSAINLSALFGAFRVVTVGCDNRLTPEYLELKRSQDPTKNWTEIYAFTFARINNALKMRKMWLPDFVSVADASMHELEWGTLLSKKTWIDKEMKMLDEVYALVDTGKAKLELPEYARTLGAQDRPAEALSGL